MKQFKAFMWIGGFITVAGVLFGGLYGLLFWGLLAALGDFIREGIVWGPLLGGMLGGGAGIVLGFVVGLSVAIVISNSDLPPDDETSHRIKQTAAIAAGLATGGMVILLVLAERTSLLNALLFWGIPASVAFVASNRVVHSYVKSLQHSEGETAERARPKSSLGLIHQFSNWLILAYGLGVSIPLAIDLVFGEGWLPIAFYNTFAHLLWLPGFLLLPMTLLRRRWGLVLLMLAPVMAFVAVFGVRYTRYLPQQEPVLVYGNEDWYLDVMTYNIQWRDASYQGAIRVIMESDADVVALQELSFEAAEQIEAELSNTYPYMALHPQTWGINGQGPLSRYPILDTEYWQADGVFGAQEAVIEFGAEPYTAEIVIHNVHPFNPVAGGSFFDPDARTRGINSILARMEDNESNHRLLLGDFNMPELSADHANVAEEWMDVYLSYGKGMGLTYTVGTRLLGSRRIPLLRLDYIFTNGYIETQDVWVIEDTGGSDHHPLITRLYFNLDPTRS